MPTAAQVAETSVTVNSSPIQDRDNHTKVHAGHSYDVACNRRLPNQNHFHCNLETTNRSQVSLTTTDSVWFHFFLFLIFRPHAIK